MSKHNRCDGWYQCPTCPRPDGAPVPCGTPAAEHPLNRCPKVSGASCRPTGACCSKRLGCPFTDPCPEFIPNSCSKMPKVNCAANIPDIPGSVMAWRPAPSAIRTCPRSQAPASSCRPGPTEPCDRCPGPRPCDRPNDAKYLKLNEPCWMIKYKPDLPPVAAKKMRRCNPPPPVPITTCGRIGSRRLTERIDFKYSYPGYEDTPNGRYVRCQPHVSCLDDVGYHNSGCARKPVQFYMAQVVHTDD